MRTQRKDQASNKPPIQSNVARRMLDKLLSPSATLQEISEIIKADQGLTAFILNLANSSYYSIPGGVSDVTKALQYIGSTTLATAILTLPLTTRIGSLY
jgi:HD-like signal output (HDOD) protein